MLLPRRPLRFLLTDDPGAGKTSWTARPKTLLATDWDLVVGDEAHKMSATFFVGEVKMTQSHRLGRLLGGIARPFLLLTATPRASDPEAVLYHEVTLYIQNEFNPADQLHEGNLARYRLRPPEFRRWEALKEQRS